MHKKDSGEKAHDPRRHAGYGSDEGKDEATKDQRDPQDDSPHMPRHWQSPGTRGERPGQEPPKPDDREPARGNQYGETGEIAGEQVREELSERRAAPPQRRDNDQLTKRPGERAEDLPTPKPETRK
ncbi:MAG TPA: hypothetical protein VKY60_04495 [Burkholderiaceae bacterium]|jgi:hypothetical protein|nr:hypothetical protein [Burkholderiaceae bacterium]